MEWIQVFVILGVFAAFFGIFAVLFIYFLNGVDKRFTSFERKFEVHELRFEALDNRIFQVAMGRSLKDILLEEKSKKKAKGE